MYIESDTERSSGCPEGWKIPECVCVSVCVCVCIAFKACNLSEQTELGLDYERGGHYILAFYCQ